jgi:hypothetical protein
MERYADPVPIRGSMEPPVNRLAEPGSKRKGGLKPQKGYPYKGCFWSLPIWEFRCWFDPKAG